MANIEIQRGATEQITVSTDEDLTGYSCYLSIGKENKPSITIDNEQMTMSVEDGETTLVYTLTQEQTLSLKKGDQFMQLRAINNDDAIGWPLVPVKVLPVIDQSVIEDEY